MNPDQARQLARYLSRGHYTVTGWLDPKSAEITASLGAHQTDIGIKGSVAEIGIHHGRLFILLALLAQSDERALAIDLFENQEENEDNSGKGDREAFYTNLRRYGIAPSDLAIFARSSFSVSAPQVVEEVGPLRLLSIDGGHFPECVLNDLSIADGAMAPGGIVIMDDVFNFAWPGVVTAYAKYLTSDPQIVPFATSPGKVFAARPAYASSFREFLRQSHAVDFNRSDAMFGFAVDSYQDMRWPSTPVRALNRLRNMWRAR